MLPNPINPLGRFVSQVAAIEVSAEKKVKAGVFPVRCPQLTDLLSFLFPPLVRVCEISCRLCLDQDRKVAVPSRQRHDRRIYRNVNLLAALLRHHNINAECVCSWFHFSELNHFPLRRRSVTTLFEPVSD